MRPPTADAPVGALRTRLSSASGRGVVAAAATVILALLVVGFARVGADWPAQDFRAHMADHGLTVWSNAWYSGIALPGYSVLYPLFAAVLGSSAVGVVSTTAAAGFAAALAPRRPRWAALFGAGVVLCLLECLVIGQTTFLLGAAFAAAALVALRAERNWWVLVAAVACSLASPLVGVFLVLGGLALLRSLGPRRVAGLAGGLAGAAVAAVVDSGGGPFTYHLVTLLAIGTFCLATLVLTERRDRAIRDFACWYLLIAAVAFVIDNPVGANLNRLGKLIAVPLAIWYLATRAPSGWRRIGVALGVAVATWWSLLPMISAVQWGADNPGRDSAYYRGVLSYLRTQDPAHGRVEIPFTRTHNEAYWVARSFPLARGWERQVDLNENGVLYSPLTAASYRRWLDEHAVSIVALSSLTPDVGGEAEADLLRHPPGYLHPVWHDAHWQVWTVERPTPIASGAARLTELGPASLTLRFGRAGPAVVRVHASPLWTVTDGPASLARTRAGWMRVTAERPGRVTLRARLNVRLLDPTDELR